MFFLLVWAEKEEADAAGLRVETDPEMALGGCSNKLKSINDAKEGNNTLKTKRKWNWQIKRESRNYKLSVPSSSSIVY